MVSIPRFAMAALVGLLAAASFSAGAQQVYRIVGPDGKVTFSDRPPPDAASKTGPASAGGGATAAPAGSGLGVLPFELRGVASKFPVTLYTGPDCAPCGNARGYLQGRGIPFTERTVTSEDDFEALKRLAGAPRLPFLTIGGQQLRGYSDAEWGTFLDAAGYPRSSQLPAGFRNPPPAPLVATQAPPVRAAASQPQAVRPAAAAAAPTEVAPPNPSGIRF